MEESRIQKKRLPLGETQRRKESSENIFLFIFFPGRNAGVFYDASISPIVHFYNGRGTAEQWIKESKYARIDRL